jgi:EmrB/QacA subfamily drug resistance transporter
MADPADDPRSLAALRARYGDDHRWWVLWTVMIGNMAAVMAATTINVAVPAISQAFSLGQQQAQWLATAFMGPMTLSMLATPWLLERFGYRVAYFALLLLLLLGFGGAVGGLSSSIGLVLAMRMVEGLAAGVLQTIPAVIILRAFARHEQGRAMGYFGFGTVLAPAIGPSVGGVLVAWFGWRAIFFFVLPFCLLSAEMARRFLPHAAPGGVPVNEDAPRPDPWSLLMLSAALAALLVGLGRLHGADLPSGLALLCASAVLSVVFVVRQRSTPAPLLRLQLFESPVFSAGAVVSVVYGATLYGSTYLLPVFMVATLGLPTTTVGAVLMPAGFALAVSIPLAGRLLGRMALHRTIAGGLAATGLSFAAMVLIGPASAVSWIVAAAMLGRIGLGFVIPSLSIGAMRDAAPELIPFGSSVTNFLRQLGGAIGVGLVGIGLEWRLRAHGAGDSLSAYHEVFAMMAVLTLLSAWVARRMRAPPDEPPKPT